MAAKIKVTVWLFVVISSVYSHITTTPTTVDPPFTEDLEKSLLIHGTGNAELERYTERVKILHRLLKSECQSLKPVHRLRREVEGLEKTLLEVEFKLYKKMARMLTECRKKKLEKKANSRTNAPTTTSTTSRLTSMTTIKPQPAECQTARNLTESWRRDNNGSKINRGDAQCDSRDMKTNKPWFRFAGDAGNQLLNSCPPVYSCGTHVAIWSDASMPSVVGQLVSVTAYGSHRSGCRGHTVKISVIRCSNIANDFIYRFLSISGPFTNCYDGFCGMIGE